jgi:hypothetical protein
MIKQVFLCLLFALFFFNGFAAKRIPGYYINKQKDTVWVTFKVPFSFVRQEPVFEPLQWKVKFYDQKNQKQKLLPRMAEEYGFTYRGRSYKMLSRFNNVGLMGSLFGDNSYVFLHLLKDGKMKLFNSYQTSGGGPGMYGGGGVMMGGGSYSVEKLIMQKEGGELFRTGWLNFKKDMIHYLVRLSRSCYEN